MRTLSLAFAQGTLIFNRVMLMDELWLGQPKRFNFGLVRDRLLVLCVLTCILCVICYFFGAPRNYAIVDLRQFPRRWRCLC